MRILRVSVTLRSIRLHRIHLSDRPIYASWVYLEILGRSADLHGMLYYGSLLESGEITIEELRQELLDSEEYSLKFSG